MVNKISEAIRCNNRSIISLYLTAILLGCSPLVALTLTVGASSGLPSSEIVLLDQDFSKSAGIPENIVLGNNLEYDTTARLSYSSPDGAIEYKTTGNQTGSVYVGIEPFINGNISISLRVKSDSSDSSVNIQGSTFWIQTQTLGSGARVVSHYQTSPTSYAYQYYDVPVSALQDGVDTINIMICGTTKTLTVYHDSAHKVVTPMSDWSVQELPYCPITLPMIRIDNEKSGGATWISTLLHAVKETVNGGVVSMVPGNDFVPFGIDYPRDYANSLGTQFMSSHDQKGVAWADLQYLENEPRGTQFIESLLDAGWELGIHYNTSLIDHSIAEAQSFMREQYDELTTIFGRSPTSWCSYQNADNVTHAAFAYEELGMIWRNGYSGDAYIANIGNLQETGWTDFWSKVSAAQMVYPSFTHQTDQSVPEAYSISYSTFTKWINNYDGKQLVGFNEYYYRLRNQIDTKIHYLDYSEGKSLRFSVECNQFPSRLIISFPKAADATVQKNGNLLVKDSDYSVIDYSHIMLFSKSSDVYEIRSANIPDAPTNLQAMLGKSQLTLTWSAPSNDGGSPITNYLVYRASGESEEKLLITLGNVLAYTDTSLVDGQEYHYKVSAVNAFGESPLSQERSVILVRVPSAPTIVSVVPGSTQISLSWTPPTNEGGSNITGYNLYRGTSSDDETLLATLGNVLTYTDDSLANEVIYYYKVSAISGAGEGASSNEVSAAPATMPVDPGNSILSADEQIAYSLISIAIAMVCISAGFLYLRRKKV